jgi:hypothetical protein
LASAQARAVAGVDPTVSERAACLAGAAERFDRAARAQPVHERSYTIADREVVLRFAGPRLVEPLGAALEHHPPGQSSGARLTVHLWEVSEAAGMPPFPETARDGGITADERTRDPGRIRLKYQEPQYTLCLLDRAADTAYVCVADADLLPHWELGSPLSVVLQWWMEDHGRQLVHGAALGTERGGILLVGRGGSGKSSTALATLSPATETCELRYAGDDYCLVSVGSEPYAYSLYGTGKLNPDQAERFPDLVSGPVLNPAHIGEEKTLFLVSRRRRERMIDRFPLRALVVPTIDGGRCRVEPISRGAALLALAPSTVLQRQGAGGRVLATLADLTRSLPSYVLRLSPDPREAPPVLAALVDSLADSR